MKRIPLAAVLALVVASCGDDNGAGPGEPGDRGDVASITVTGSGTLAALGESLQLDAEAFDQDGDPVSGVTFAWTSAADDVATVDDDGLVTAVSNGSATIRASVDGTSGSIAVQVDQVPTGLAFAAPPTNGSVDVPFAQLEVEALDANGNAATNFTGAVTVSIGTNPQAGSLSGEVTRNAMAGVASFPGMSLDTAGGGYTLVASTGALDVESDPFNVTLPSVYVVNEFSNSVSVIATASNTVVATIRVGSLPHGVALSPDGLLAYVANSGSNNVHVIQTPSNTVSGTINVGDFPQGVAFTPDGAFAYVTNLNDGSVSVIETATNSVTTTITGVGPGRDVLVTPDGATAYVAQNGDSVIAISTATNTVTARIETGHFAAGSKLGITPDGTSVYATAFLTPGNVYAIDTETNTLVDTISIGGGARSVAFEPDGTFGYVTKSATGSPNIFVIDPATNTVTAAFSVGSEPPAGVDFTPDGATAYVALRSGVGLNDVALVLAVDPVTQMVTESIAVGSHPFVLRVMPAPLP